MDPHATLELFDTAMDENDREAIVQPATDLIIWLERGGFMPCGPNGTDWRGKLTSNQLASYLRMARAIAEMD